MRLKFCLALSLLLLLLSPRARAATNMFSIPPTAVTGITNATPIVVAVTAMPTGSAANDWVLIQGVTPDNGTTGPNGIFQCSAVDATHCTLSGSTAAGVFVSGGTLTPLGSNLAGASNNWNDPRHVNGWFDCSQCAKTTVFIYSNAGSVATAKIEATSRAALTSAGQPTPASTLVSITNPDNGATGNGFYSPAIGSEFLRVNLSAWTSGTVYAVLTCEGFAGQRIW